jgi:Ran GTPase-activating protein (RanGAP) involved in mRNA processing and transport
MINISDNSIGVEGIKTMLNGLTPNTFNLIYLNLTNNDLGPECIPDLKVMLESPHLQELRLSANTLNDTSAEALSLFFYKQV